MRQLACALALAAALCIVGSAPARADDCPPVMPDTSAVDPECLNAKVPTVDADGDPIPYVEEVTAPPVDTALVADTP